ncbi:carbohydrate ABC transporter permease [Jatrophihabitans telluris]|uniref:Carbohydrate ABC transporter permease n=1 Tax=Jatrophihabitans telluris TaxID=2038343 RepID=A0ABY4QVV7_9ACTN|nr:carbohydrate ABC transporter permease [Jatrophihabitans telluris]UQX87578.1 carbohydrate ABC transporter permease [Jatrophihabitans telluris]
MSATTSDLRPTAARKRPAVSERRAVTRMTGGLGGTLLSALAWLMALVFFFPILWMLLLSFRSESDAASPRLLAAFTGVNYHGLFSGDVKIALLNSLNAAVTSTVLVILLAVPAAYALSIRPVKKWTDVLFFFLSTKMMPAVAALLPVYLITNNLGFNDNIWALIVMYMAANLPIAIWMLRSFLLEVPREIIEAAQVDGAGLLTILRKVIMPVIAPGLAATALICFIFSWNEFLFALRLTGQNAKTAPVFLAGSIAPEGLFLAHLCAVAFVVCLPVLIAGWVAQDKLVRGLSLGAVK